MRNKKGRVEKMAAYNRARPLRQPATDTGKCVTPRTRRSTVKKKGMGERRETVEEMAAYHRHITSFIKPAEGSTARSDGTRGWSRYVDWSREPHSRQGRIVPLLGSDRARIQRHPVDRRRPALDLNIPYRKQNVRCSHGGRQARRRDNIIVL